MTRQPKAFVDAVLEEHERGRKSRQFGGGGACCVFADEIVGLRDELDEIGARARALCARVTLVVVTGAWHRDASREEILGLAAELAELLPIDPSAAEG